MKDVKQAITEDVLFEEVRESIQDFNKKLKFKKYFWIGTACVVTVVAVGLTIVGIMASTDTVEIIEN